LWRPGRIRKRFDALWVERVADGQARVDLRAKQTIVVVWKMTPRQARQAFSLLVRRKERERRRGRVDQ
jgi:hypothetical protein